MAPTLLEKITRFALWFLPIGIVVGFIALWWLKQQGAASAAVVAPVVAIALMVYINLFSYRQQRRLDEVQIASQRFASAYGWTKGAMVAVLLLMLPPVTNWLVDFVNIQSTGSATLSDRGAVRLALLCGAMLVMVMQGLAFYVSTAVWWRRMGGMRERS